MNRVLAFIIGFVLIGEGALAQVITADPEFPTMEDEVTITFNAAEGNGGLAGYTGDVYAHTGVITSNSTSSSDWKYVVAEWTVNIDKAKLTRISGDTYELSITPSIKEFYGVPDGETIEQLAFVFRSGDRTREGKTAANGDIFYEVFEEGFAVSVSSPEQNSLLVSTNEVIPIEATASEAATFELSINDEVVATQASTTTFAYEHTVTETSGTSVVSLTATSGSNDVSEITFSYTIGTATAEEPLPSGLLKGINYDPNDNTKATLVLHAPLKSRVYVRGDFNEWQFLSDYQMKKDGDLFWLEINGLTPNEEYAFQYVVDESIYIADPYSDQILQPGDQFIADGIYPDLKSFPIEASNPVGVFNTVSVLETNQAEFNWQNDGYDRPKQTDLVVYELLIRDFFDNGEESYANLLDTLSYIKSLGVNAIELMPTTEFAGNDSWGYNPTFMFAVDKAYGPKEDLKRLIDAAHGMGMAVILDMVLNHQDLPSPLLLLDWNFDTGRPSDENPYFNNSGNFENGATHEFSVFFDFNHLEPLVEAYTDSVNHYWLSEYHFDGYRFDLTKGFMQTGSFFSYNQERVNILKRMADAIWEVDPEAYVIFEHLGENDEETELANYGIMLWGIMHANYKENVLGFEGGSNQDKLDLRWTYHGTRGWNDPHVVGYMESHDEERLMYEAISFGNTSNAAHNVRDTTVALGRIAAASSMLYMIPGPKMLWQFGELGYDVSINFIDRVAQKPNPWNGSEGLNYNNEQARNKLRQTVSELIKLKTSYSVFNTGSIEFLGNQNLTKQITILNEANTNAPSSADEMNAIVVANFDVESRVFGVTLPHNGAWYDYFSGSELIDNTTTLGPGDFKVFTDFQLETPELILSLTEEDFVKSELRIYPNPVLESFQISSTSELLYYFLYDLEGRLVKAGKFVGGDTTVRASGMEAGLYVIETISRGGHRSFQKVIKK